MRTTITADISPAYKERLRRLARAANLTLGAYIARAIETHLYEIDLKDARKRDRMAAAQTRQSRESHNSVM